MSTGLYKGTDVIELTDGDFDMSGPEPVLKGGPGMVMAYSAHCPYCINKKEVYTELAKRLNNKPGYQMYSIHTLDPKTNGVGRGLNVRFIPMFFEADGSGRMTPYPGENFGLEQVMERAKAHAQKPSNKPYMDKAKRLGKAKGIDISRLQPRLRQEEVRQMVGGGGKSASNRHMHCKGITKDGYPCSRKAIPGEEYCYQH